MRKLILILLLAMPIFAQSPLLELHDNKIPGRKLIVFADRRYQFFPFPGARPFEGVAVFEKAGKCGVKFSDNQIYVLANGCNWTGVAVAGTIVLTDSVANVPPNK